MVSKSCVGMVLVLVLLAGCGAHRDGVGRGQKQTHQIFISVVTQNGTLVAKVDSKNLEIYRNGNDHNIHWVIDSQAQKDWQFSNLDPAVSNSDIKFTDTSAVPNEFADDPSDKSNGSTFSLKDVLGKNKSYPYTIILHRKGTGTPPTLTVPDTDPAITNHGG